MGMVDTFIECQLNCMDKTFHVNHVSVKRDMNHLVGV